MQSLKTLVPSKPEGQHIRLLSVTRVQVAGVRDACVLVNFSIFLPLSPLLHGDKGLFVLFQLHSQCLAYKSICLRKNGRNACCSVFSACEKATEQQAEIALGPGNQEATIGGRQHGDCPVLSNQVASVTWCY